MKKNEEYLVDIIDNGFQGEGIAKIDGQIVFIPTTIKGEKVKIKILKVTSKCAYGKALEIIEKSESRIESDCKTYSKCGGCSLRHVNYSETLNMKKVAVQNTLRKMLGNNIDVKDTIGMENPMYYRNKLQYPVGTNENGEAVIGVYSERTHKIIPTQNCKIQNEISQNIANDILNFINENKIPAYNEETLEGILRHIVIRIGVTTNEIMVTLVVNAMKFPKEKELVEFLTQKYQEIKTIAKNLNNKNTNVILGDKTEIIFGDGYIYDYLGECKFKISPMSFYQVNPIQTKKLYSKAVEYASLTGEETIFDLYCGIGTIGIFASNKVKKMYGIETIPEAIEDAKENAKLNNIENAEFFVGDVEKVLPDLIEKRNLRADVVFIDPPRKGCDKIALDTILKVEPKKVVYVSCNPATLARDLKILEEKYEIKEVTPVDMFPFTSHVECVACLELKQTLDK
jgi:23S rRNA (uracil1939-C5)-methyltransferase